MYESALSCLVVKNESKILIKEMNEGSCQWNKKKKAHRNRIFFILNKKGTFQPFHPLITETIVHR